MDTVQQIIAVLIAIAVNTNWRRLKRLLAFGLLKLSACCLQLVMKLGGELQFDKPDRVTLEFPKEEE